MMRSFVLRDEVNCRQLYTFLRSNWLAMAQAGKPLGVLVAEHKAKRTGPQNRFYWGTALRSIAENAWVDGKQYSENAWHEYLAGKFIGYEDMPGGGQTPISTASLSVDEFSVYLERVMQYAAEHLGVIVE
jgi:hypothetical protein